MTKWWTVENWLCEDCVTRLLEFASPLQLNTSTTNEFFSSKIFFSQISPWSLRHAMVLLHFLEVIYVNWLCFYIKKLNSTSIYFCIKVFSVKWNRCSYTHNEQLNGSLQCIEQSHLVHHFAKLKCFLCTIFLNRLLSTLNLQLNFLLLYSEQR